MARAAEQDPERKGQHHRQVVLPWLLYQGGFHGDTQLAEHRTSAAFCTAMMPVMPLLLNVPLVSVLSK